MEGNRFAQTNSGYDWLQLPPVDLLTVEQVQDDVVIESGLEQSDAFAVSKLPSLHLCLTSIYCK